MLSPFAVLEQASFLGGEKAAAEIESQKLLAEKSTRKWSNPHVLLRLHHFFQNISLFAGEIIPVCYFGRGGGRAPWLYRMASFMDFTYSPMCPGASLPYFSISSS